MKDAPIDLAADCRRLFLRKWRPFSDEPKSELRFVSVSVYVRFADSTSSSDDFDDVFDYNVMRDALVAAGNPAEPNFLVRAIDALRCSPVVAAEIEIEDPRTGAITQSVKTVF